MSNKRKLLKHDVWSEFYNLHVLSLFSVFTDLCLATLNSNADNNSATQSMNDDTLVCGIELIQAHYHLILGKMLSTQ